MRTPFTISLLLLIAAPGIAQTERLDMNAAAVQEDRSDARWAELEAQSRVIEGDYDGAVQAEQQAKADHQKIEQQETGDKSPKH